MNKNINKFLNKNIMCPNCNSVDLYSSTIQLECSSCNAIFPIAPGERPVLIRDCNKIFPPSAYINQSQEQPSREKLFTKLIPSSSVNINRIKSLHIFAKSLESFNPAYILVVGGGKQKEELEKILTEYKNLCFIYTDIDTDASVDVFCDAHEIPFRDQVFHGIVTTAVLEHVLYPEQVVHEIHRVLIEDGVIYSEIPFIQQVHEGAYDFTRYTLSGHRRLLNQFAELDSGLVAGPATALVWSIERFALCFTLEKRSALIVKAGIRIFFFWIKYFDYLIQNNPHAMDGASCTYFLGKKIIGAKISDQAIIEGYTGAIKLRHN